MQALSEKETFELIRENLRLAAEDCREIASQPLSGMQFLRLRSRLKTVEDCCRDAMWFREDCRWSELSMKFEQIHQIARRWLHSPSVPSKRAFVAMAGAILWLLQQVERLWTQRTNHFGMILPIVGNVVTHEIAVSRDVNATLHRVTDAVPA